MYFGQQNITAVAPSGGAAGTAESPINTQPQINAITYTVNANPVTNGGTWVANGTNANNAFNQFGGEHMDAVLGPTINGYNYPINVYPAGNYGYSVTPAEDGAAARAGETVTVNYPAGLGTSVSANFTNGNAASPSTTVSGSSNALGFGGSNNTNGPLLNGSGTTNVDQNVVFNNAVQYNGTPVAENSTITLTENSTRPQSVWYTVSASGKGTDTNPITQTGYELTQAEKDNIFAINTGKIAGATNTGLGGYGYGMGNNSSSSSLNTGNTYTTTTCGNQNGSNISTTYGQPFAQLTTTLKTGTASAATSRVGSNIALSQNYLPLGITANVKDAYFNHNGII